MVTATWRPDGRGVTSGGRQPAPHGTVHTDPAAGTAGETCAGETACRVSSTNPAAPGASLTVWVHPVHGPAGNVVLPGCRHEYRAGNPGDVTAPWTHTGYGTAAPRRLARPPTPGGPSGPRTGPNAGPPHAPGPDAPEPSGLSAATRNEELTMRLLPGSRPRAGAPVTWHPVGKEPVPVPSQAMEDPRCAGPAAYEVSFFLWGSDSDSTVTAWFYPVPSEKAGIFALGFRYRYRAHAPHGTWTEVAYGADPADLSYGGLVAADAHASAVASLTARMGTAFRAWDFPGWDGTPQSARRR